MTQLSEETCEACRIGAPLLTSAELAELRVQIPAWRVVEEEGVKKLRREFDFKNFTEALAFANRVGDLAEAHNHHPAITVEWGKTTVVWWTHKIRGLHRNDAVLAAKTDVLLNQATPVT